MYSDENSMGNGNSGNGESALALVPQPMEQGVIPHMLARPAHPMFGGQRIFVHAPYYHWYAHAAASVDKEAREHLTTLA